MLRHVLGKFEARGWVPVVAPEVEFYLLNAHSDPNAEAEPPQGRLGRTEGARGTVVVVREGRDMRTGVLFQLEDLFIVDAGEQLTSNIQRRLVTMHAALELSEGHMDSFVRSLFPSKTGPFEDGQAHDEGFEDTTFDVAEPLMHTVPQH